MSKRARLLRLAARLERLAQDIGEQSRKLFVMRSPFTPKGWRFDHIGFVLQDGSLKDMSGHRYDEQGVHPLPPVRYQWSQVEDLFKMPGSKEEANRGGFYSEVALPKIVTVPDNVVCRTTDPKARAVNCTSFVKIILSNSGISTPASNKPDDIFEHVRKLGR